jgi:rhomboid protease GluP
MLALWDAGHVVERIYGRAWFIMLYLVSGLAASFASAWVHPAGHSAGASGAIFGVYGCLLAFMIHPSAAITLRASRAEASRTLAFIAYTLVYGYLHPGIDNVGHLGGLVSGFAMGFVFARALHAVPVAGVSPVRES